MAKQRLQEKYEKEVAGTLAKEFGIANKMAVPRLEKVVLNVGIGNMVKNKEAVEALKKDLMAISGQAVGMKLAKVSIATFNLRRGMTVGMAVTLRGERMYAFLDRLFSIVLPRLRDFRGVSTKSFDRGGNYTLGVIEHTIFPEVDLSKSAPHGLEISIVVNSGDPEKSKRLLDLMGMPFVKESN